MDRVSWMSRALFAAGFLVMATGVAHAQGAATANDTARYLAGLAPSASSPLAPLAEEAGWKSHARAFDDAWKRLEAQQLSKIRTWSKANLTNPRPVNYYMFSGPDYLYADAFFPGATTYVLSGLEPVGNVPEISAMPKGSIYQGLAGLRNSLSTILNRSFFITKNMRSNFASSRFTGTLPVLYTFIARSGHSVDDVEFFSLASDGSQQPASEKAEKGAARGVKIGFTTASGTKKALYYFSTDISDGGLPTSGFLQFCEKLGLGDSFLKSSSYHLHEKPFSKMRDFLVANSAAIVQDDTGVPLKYLEASQWEFKPFGQYLGPIGIFGMHYQRDLKQVFKDAQAIDFGMGYRWRVQESNLLLAVRRNLKAAEGHQ